LVEAGCALARGIGGLAVKILSRAGRLIKLSLKLRSRIAPDDACAFFDLAADIPRSARDAVFIHDRTPFAMVSRISGATWPLRQCSRANRAQASLRPFLLLKHGKLRRTLGDSASPRSPLPRTGVQNMRAAQPIAAFSGSVSAQSDWFSRLAVYTAILTGKPITFLGAVTVVAIWAVTGPFFHFSDTWQLVINTGTTIITFLMVFLIQATQNRDTLALQIKLSELILALEGARNELAAVEKQPEKTLENIAQDIHARASAAGPADRAIK
jgi:low affinity Fe/Cu permease